MFAERLHPGRSALENSRDAGRPPAGAAGEFCLRAGRGSVRRSEPRGASGDSPRRMEAAPRAERVLDPPPFQAARGWGAERRGFRSLWQAASHGLYSDFFAALAGVARAFKEPVLFLHGQFHAWEVQRGFLAKNITRVMAAGGSAPPPEGDRHPGCEHPLPVSGQGCAGR